MLNNVLSITNSTITLDVMHPGSYLKEEIEARGWMQRDLAFILGCQESSLQQIISGKRGISVEMATSLGDTFDVSPEFFINLQKRYELSRAKKASKKGE